MSNTTTSSENKNLSAPKAATFDLSNQSDNEPWDVQGATRQGDVNPVGAGRVCTRGCGIGRGTAGHKRDVGRGRGRGRARNNSGNVAAAYQVDWKPKIE